ADCQIRRHPAGSGDPAGANHKVRIPAVSVASAIQATTVVCGEILTCSPPHHAVGGVYTILQMDEKVKPRLPAMKNRQFCAQSLLRIGYLLVGSSLAGSLMNLLFDCP
ncbi:MAG: hypothetical protein KAX26_01165, partial [Anaerolineae bacterium]|nr:hypothetical protein [Anaerolineae bacterium]